MPRKNLKSLNAEFEAKKLAIKREKRKAAEAARRKLKRDAGKPSPRGEWADLPVSDKAEVVISWSINGGALNGRRYHAYELREALGLTPDGMQQLQDKAERLFLRVYEERGALANLVAKAITKTFHQLEADRGRVVQHSDLLERERLACLEEIQRLQKKTPPPGKAHEAWWRKVSRFWTIYTQLSEQQTEVLGVLNSHNASAIEFIRIFNQKHGPDPANKKPGEDSGDNQLVTLKEAYRLIEEYSPQILPSQKTLDERKGSRDPDAAFKELKKPDA